MSNKSQLKKNLNLVESLTKTTIKPEEIPKPQENNRKSISKTIDTKKTINNDNKQIKKSKNTKNFENQAESLKDVNEEEEKFPENSEKKSQKLENPIKSKDSIQMSIKNDDQPINKDINKKINNDKKQINIEKNVKKTENQATKKPTPKPLGDKKPSNNDGNIKQTKNQENNENQEENLQDFMVEEEKIQENIEKPQNYRKTNENITKMQINKKSTKEIDKEVSCLDKIITKKEEKLENNEFNLNSLSKSLRKKRGKQIRDRQNIFENHNFENLLKMAEGISNGDEKYNFNDYDYMEKDTNDKEIVQNEKFLGNFENYDKDLFDELVKGLEWVEMNLVAKEKRLSKFLNVSAKGERDFKQKIIMGKLDDNPVLK